MILGALLDLGVPLDGLRAALGSLAIDYGEVSAGRVVRSGISATKFNVGGPGGQGAGGRLATITITITTRAICSIIIRLRAIHLDRALARHVTITATMPDLTIRSPK